MTDLDSFFAKKDKKKVKGKKFTTSDEIAKRLEESEKKEQSHVLKIKVEPVKKVEDDPDDTSNPPEEPPQKEEEEWNDFKDDADRDLGDLKISKLQIENEEDLVGTTDDDGEKGEHGDKRDGVWKTESRQAPRQAPVTIEPEEKGRPAVNSSYVPPHMRNASPMSKSTPRRNRTAPDITNEVSFPSLSEAQASNPVGAWGKRRFNNEGFESVKHGSTRVVTDHDAPPKLSTANRFDALSDSS
ncbi:hypothetical protein SK128_003607 [Halocaridina rubra]|uniref:Protein CDV3 homolog n=1 Tax=Halocaridina rubra TaxID=373956 RepID=A0AAN8WQH4_HALRR